MRIPFHVNLGSKFLSVLDCTLAYVQYVFSVCFFHVLSSVHPSPPLNSPQVSERRMWNCFSLHGHWPPCVRLMCADRRSQQILSASASFSSCSVDITLMLNNGTTCPRLFDNTVNVLPDVFSLSYLDGLWLRSQIQPITRFLRLTVNEATPLFICIRIIQFNRWPLIRFCHANSCYHLTSVCK